MKKVSYFILFLVLCALIPSCCTQPCHGDKQKKNEKISFVPQVYPVIANGDTVSGFTATSGAWAKVKTVVSTSYDKENISFRFVSFIEKGVKIKCEGRKKDDMTIFSGEGVELFLCTEPETGKYYQFAVNPKGVMYSAIGKNYSWDPKNVKVKTLQKSDRWIMDITIPFKDLGLPHAPAKGTIWNVNFCRTYCVSGLRESSNFAGISAYHDPAQFAKMVFDEKGTQSRVVMEDFQFFSGKVKAAFSFENIKEPVTVEIARGSFINRTNNLPASGNIVITAELPADYIALKNNLEPVFVTVKNSVTGKVIFSKKFSISAEGKDMLLPDKYYYTAQDKKISFILNHPREEKNSPMKVVLSTRDGKIFREAVFTDRGSFSTAGLKENTYILTASCSAGRTQRILEFRKKATVPAPLKKGSILALKDGALTYDGKFIYLISGSGTGKPFPEGKFFNFRAGNFGTMPNAVQMSGFPGRRLIRSPKVAYTYPDLKKFYAMVDKLLSRANPASPVLRRFTYEAQIPTFLPGEKGKKYKEVSSVDLHKDLYKYCKKKYPKLLYTLQTDSPDHVKRFVNACDIMEVTPSGGYSNATVEHLKFGLPRARKALGNKPVIYWQGVTIPNNRCRRAEELRAAVFLNIMYGASGTIMHMGHGRLPLERSRLWSMIKNLNYEINSFYPRYRAMPLAETEKVLDIKAKHEYCARVRSNGKNAIALVLSLASGENIVELRSVNGWKVVKGGKVGKKESWTPYEARVYYLKK